MTLLSLDAAKRSFFDARPVLAAASRAKDRNLARAGAYVMRAARKRIKSGRKGKITSKPGESPRSQVGTLKRLIFFGRTPQGSVLVGPVLFPQARRAARAVRGTVPSVLESSGRIVFPPRPKTARRPAQPSRQATIAARPFMAPALASEAPKFPGLWRNSIRKST